MPADDLMAALRASIDRAKAARADPIEVLLQVRLPGRIIGGTINVARAAWDVHPDRRALLLAAISDATNKALEAYDSTAHQPTTERTT